MPASIEYYNDTITNKTKAQMVYKIKMRRKSRFYIVNIIIPTFLLSFLSVCVFYLPTDDGEKITLSLSILFALGKIKKLLWSLKNAELFIYVFFKLKLCSFCLLRKSYLLQVSSCRSYPNIFSLHL